MKGFHKEIVSFLTILENYFDAMTWLQGNYLSNLRKYLVKYETQKCILILPFFISKNVASWRETNVYTIIHENAYSYVLGWTAQNNWCCNIPSSKKRFFLTVPHSFPKPSFMNQDTAGKSRCKLFIYDTVRKMSEWWC